MFPQNSKKLVFDNFMGLYARGLPDDVPKDHFISLVNLVTTRKGQLSTRSGFDLTSTSTNPIVRLFVSTINGNKQLLILDIHGNIYANGTLIYTNSAMVDFSAINMFNKTFILPIVNSLAYPSPLQIWLGVGTMTRAALGFAPSQISMAATSTGSGVVSAGVHKLAVSFITNSGFTTQPGPLVILSGVFAPVSVTCPGGQTISVTGIPTGPADTVARQIFATQANLDTYYYVDQGYIPNNTATTVTLNFADTDLAVDASALFNLAQVITGGAQGWLTSYHGRLIILGQTTQYTGNMYVPYNADTVRVSNSGDAESFDLDTGYLQIPSQNDDNIAAGSIQINDNLYITKARAGIYSVTDNYDVPTTWPIIPADFSAGGVGYGIASVQSNATASEILDFALICDRTGLYAFNGTIQYPSLTYKIDDIWKNVFSNQTISNGVNLVVDTFENLIYISMLGYPYIVVGDYSQGLNHESIIWSLISFQGNTFGIVTILFGDIGDSQLALRAVFGGLATYRSIYSLSLTSTDDDGVAIGWSATFAYAEYEEGQVNIFNGLRFRIAANGSGNTNLVFGTPLSSAPNLVVTPTVQDLLRQINYVNEKLAVEISGSDTTGGITLQRMDVFGKPMWPARPQ